ncbi:MAG: 16S rRNA (cytidine(1402)-2'-O)-methyltransferase [Spirochaetes bacterium]|nr:MAG: 16S rRNA (cytidine(1402)-2'-O)-methyltransferase [Spirochaetota bacterium]
MSILYIVATPIGNLKDITLRAIEVLKEVDLIACEDTRRTLKLLNVYKIKKPLVSCHARREEEGASRIVEVLKRGKAVAYMSDSGTPGISDPGAILVRRVRESGFKVVPLPGASALTSLLSITGYPSKEFFFEGFLSPRQGRRKNRLKELLDTGNGFVLYESPYRIIKLLKDIVDLDPERWLFLGREMTKKHEEYLHGYAQDVLKILTEREQIKGEFSVFVGGKKNS